MAMISACTIVKNEADNIVDWLDCVKTFADEIIVVDTGSTDDTAALARNGGARVEFFSWIGDFAAAKNFAIEQAKGDWIVFLDADEYFPATERGKVRPLIEKYHPRLDVAGFFMRMDNIDKHSKLNMGTSFYQLRVFRNVPWLRYEGRIHEYLKNSRGEKKAKMLFMADIIIFHTGYSRGLAQKKAKRNLAMIEENRAKYGPQPLDDFHIMDCYYSLGDWQRAAAYARLTIENNIKPFGQENRPHAVLIQSLMLAQAPTEEIRAVIKNALAVYPECGEFWMLWGLLDWEIKDKKSAKEHMEKGLAVYAAMREKQWEKPMGNLCLNLIPAMHLHLGQIAEEEERKQEAAEHYVQGLQARRYDSQLLMALLNILPADDTAAVIELLNGIYSRDEDASFLLNILKNTPQRKACLYYDRWAGLLSRREKYLLAGRVKEAAADLIEDISRYARLGIISGSELGETEKNMLGAVLPADWQRNLQKTDAEGKKLHTILQRLTDSI